MIDTSNISTPNHMLGEIIPDFLRRLTFKRPDEKGVVDSVGDSRAAHAAMTDDAWVNRIVRIANEFEVSAPESYVPLIEKLAVAPPEGVIRSRREDSPPPPLSCNNGVTVPEHVYSNGVVWNVGAKIGSGAFGGVYEISVEGGKNEKKRVVKIMLVKDDEVRRRSLWNEIGALMMNGDFVGSEVMQEGGETWAALILERYNGETAAKYIDEGEEEVIERIADPRAAFKMAVMIRSVVHTLRRMHAQGWTHRDVKAANVILNTAEREEFLTRLVDCGLARRTGGIREEVDDSFQGTPSYAFPEATKGIDFDLRIRDYWGVMVIAALALGLIEENFSKDDRVEKWFLHLQNGTMYKAPALYNPIRAGAFYKKHSMSDAQKGFLKWLYDFLCPGFDIISRRVAWRGSGITKRVRVDQIPEGIKFLERVEGERGLYADLLDDGKFVRELEGHIRALGVQIGRDDVEKALALMQEFPEETSSPAIT